MTEKLTVSKLYAKALLDYLHTQHIDCCHLSSALTKPDNANSSDLISANTYEALMLEAAMLTRDPYIGLHAGQHVRPGYYGALGYIAMSCATLGEALSKHLEFQNLVSNQGKVELWHEEDKVRIVWLPRATSIHYHVIENIFCTWVSFAHWICGQQVVPSLIEFQHQNSQTLDEYRKVFNCDVRFSQKNAAITIPISFLKLPLVQADQELKDLYESKAKHLIHKLQKQSPDLLQTLKIFMTQALIQGQLTLEKAALALELSPRTLQRELSKYQTTYKKLLDHVRKELAAQYIKDVNIDLIELTFLLGFSDQTSFQRAFKRWFDLSPGQFRKQKVNTILIR